MNNKEQLLIFLCMVIGIYLNPLVVKVNAQSLSKLNKSLIVAAEYGNLDKLKEYISKGADVNASYHDGSTALILASAEGHAEIVKELIAKEGIKHIHVSLSHIKNLATSIVTIEK